MARRVRETPGDGGEVVWPRLGWARMRLSRRTCEPLVPGGESAVALKFVAFLFVAHLFAQVFFERREQVEGALGRHKRSHGVWVTVLEPATRRRGGEIE